MGNTQTLIIDWKIIVQMDCAVILISFDPMALNL
jgi:hypothetical protein